MRVRFSVALAALAMFAAACANVPGGAVATVNGEPIDVDRFERIVSAQLATVGLADRDADLLDRAREVGLFDRELLDAALIAELGRTPDETRIGLDADTTIEPGFLDELFAAQLDASADPADAFRQLGVTEEAYRATFDRLVPFEARGLELNQNQTGFPLGRRPQLPALQSNIIQQLVQAEIARQAAEALDLPLDEEALATAEQRIRDSFESDEALDRALADAGYTRDDLRELFVLTPARQEALQLTDDIAAAQAFFDALEVEVAERFGSWDIGQGRLLPPSDPL